MTDKEFIKILQNIKDEIDTPNRGTCDYFIVDRIEEIVKKALSELKGKQE